MVVFEFFLSQKLDPNMGAPQVSFFRLPYGGPIRSVSSHTIWGPLRSISLHTIWGSPQVSFFTYYRGYPLRSVSSLTMWGPPQISFIA